MTDYQPGGPTLEEQTRMQTNSADWLRTAVETPDYNSYLAKDSDGKDVISPKGLLELNQRLVTEMTANGVTDILDPTADQAATQFKEFFANAQDVPQGLRDLAVEFADTKMMDSRRTAVVEQLRGGEVTSAGLETIIAAYPDKSEKEVLNTLTEGLLKVRSEAITKTNEAISSGQISAPDKVTPFVPSQMAENAVFGGGSAKGIENAQENVDWAQANALSHMSVTVTELANKLSELPAGETADLSQLLESVGKDQLKTEELIGVTDVPKITDKEIPTMDKEQYKALPLADKVKFRVEQARVKYENWKARVDHYLPTKEAKLTWALKAFTVAAPIGASAMAFIHDVQPAHAMSAGQTESTHPDTTAFHGDGDVSHDAAFQASHQNSGQVQSEPTQETHHSNILHTTDTTDTTKEEGLTHSAVAHDRDVNPPVNGETHHTNNHIDVNFDVSLREKTPTARIPETIKEVTNGISETPLALAKNAVLSYDATDGQLHMKNSDAIAHFNSSHLDNSDIIQHTFKGEYTADFNKVDIASHTDANGNHLGAGFSDAGIQNMYDSDHLNEIKFHTEANGNQDALLNIPIKDVVNAGAEALHIADPIKYPTLDSAINDSVNNLTNAGLHIDTMDENHNVLTAHGNPTIQIGGNHESVGDVVKYDTSLKTTEASWSERGNADALLGVVKDAETGAIHFIGADSTVDSATHDSDVTNAVNNGVIPVDGQHVMATLNRWANPTPEDAQKIHHVDSNPPSTSIPPVEPPGEKPPVTPPGEKPPVTPPGEKPPVTPPAEKTPQNPGNALDKGYSKFNGITGASNNSGEKAPPAAPMEKDINDLTQPQPPGDAKNSKP